MTSTLASRDEVARVGARVRAVHPGDHAGHPDRGEVVGVTVAPAALVRFDDGEHAYVPLRRLVLDVPVTDDPGDGARAGTTAPRQRQRPGPSIRWTEERIIAAVQAWAAEHGRPPAMAEWKRRGPGHPSDGTVVNRFGSWLACMARADQPALYPGRPRKAADTNPGGTA